MPLLRVVVTLMETLLPAPPVTRSLLELLESDEGLFFDQSLLVASRFLEKRYVGVVPDLSQGHGGLRANILGKGV